MSFRSPKLHKCILFLVIAATVFAVHRWWTTSNFAADQANQQSASPEELIGQIEETLAQFSVPEQSSGAGSGDAADPTSELIRKIDLATAQLMAQDGEGRGEHAKMAQVKAYFLAAQRQPGTYGDRFDELSRQLMQEFPESTSAVEVSILRFARDHDLTKPLDDNSLSSLRQQASGYSNQRNGAALYSFVSHQLYTNGQVNSAKAVLDEGTDQYRGTAGWHQLFEQKFQQGHLTEPQWTSAGGVFRSSAATTRPPKRRS